MCPRLGRMKTARQTQIGCNVWGTARNCTGRIGTVLSLVLIRALAVQWKPS